MFARRSAVHSERRIGGFGRKAALVAPFLLMLGTAIPAQASSLPELGHWHGETDDGVVTDLRLQGSLQQGGGTYEAGTLDESAGSVGPFSSAWSGRWTVVNETVYGQKRIEIRLQDATNDMIDRYFVGPNDVLEPTPDLVHRPLTPQEIAKYSLAPVNDD